MGINYDPCYVFNVDEVRIQLQERKIKMVTQKDFLNMCTENVTGHISLTLCTSPGFGGSTMPAHFLFQAKDNILIIIICHIQLPVLVIRMVQDFRTR